VKHFVQAQFYGWNAGTKYVQVQMAAYTHQSVIKIPLKLPYFPDEIPTRPKLFILKSAMQESWASINVFKTPGKLPLYSGIIETNFSVAVICSWIFFLNFQESFPI